MFQRIARTAVRRLITGLALSVTAAACHKDSSTAVPTPSTITAAAGSSAQVGTVGQQLGHVISVAVLDAAGNAVSGVPVLWTVVAGSGSVDVATSTTGASGNATTDWTLGTLAGTDSLVASTSGGLTATLVATAQPGPFASLVKMSGDQQAVADGGVSAPLVVKAVDQYGNGVANVVITWVDQAGGTLSSTSSTTDVNGLAQVTLTADANPESYTIVAEVGTLSPIVFTVTSN